MTGATPPKFPFQGTGYDKAEPFETTTDQDYLWNKRLIPAGSTTKQFQTDVSSWVAWKRPDGTTGLAAEKGVRVARQP
jgi:hypothetical protein